MRDIQTYTERKKKNRDLMLIAREITPKYHFFLHIIFVPGWTDSAAPGLYRRTCGNG